jgi:uncharacterized membrane protein
VKFSIFLALISAGLFALIRPSTAAAEFAVCNSSSYSKVNVAWAATWTDSSGNPYGESQGWWVIAQNECKIVITTADVSAYTIYVYAFAEAKPIDQTWGGTYEYCLDPGNKFLYHGDHMTAPCSAGKAFGMRQINIGGDSTYAYFLRD